MGGAHVEQHATRFGGHPPHRPAVGLDRIRAAGAALVRGDVGAPHHAGGALVGEVELRGHHLAERRAGALPEVGLADVEGRGVVGPDRDPRIQLAEVGIGIRAGALRGGELGAEPEAGGAGDREGAQADDQHAAGRQEVATRRAAHRATSFRPGLPPGRGRAAGVGHAPDRRLDAVVGHAPAQRVGHAFTDLGVGRMGVLVEERLGGEDLAVLAEAALWDLLVDPRHLQRVELAALCQPFEGGDLGALEGRHRPRAGSHGITLDQDRAGAALPEPAPEPRPGDPDVVAEHVEQGGGRVDVDGVGRPVDGEGVAAHRWLLSAHRRVWPEGYQIGLPRPTMAAAAGPARLRVPPRKSPRLNHYKSLTVPGP